MVSGTINPNTNTMFADNIDILYHLLYGISMMPKSVFTPEGLTPWIRWKTYGVLLWRLIDLASGSENKDNFSYTLMMRQPEFGIEEIEARAVDIVLKKKSELSVNKTVFDKWEDGLSVQMLHTGSYDDESKSFAQMASLTLAPRDLRFGCTVL